MEGSRYWLDEADGLVHEALNGIQFLSDTFLYCQDDRQFKGARLGTWLKPKDDAQFVTCLGCIARDI